MPTIAIGAILLLLCSNLFLSRPPGQKTTQCIFSHLSIYITFHPGHVRCDIVTQILTENLSSSKGLYCTITAQIILCYVLHYPTTTIALFRLLCLTLQIPQAR